MPLFPTSDRFNPILVRELRQMVRSRQVVLTMHLYLLLMLWFFGQSMVDQIGRGDTRNFGYMLFQGIIGIMTAATLLATVLHTAWRVATDRINEDLSWITTLTPTQQVWGRWICGLVISLLFYCMSAPFLVTAYYFRGVDYWMFLYYLPLTFLGIQMVNLVALAVFSAVRSPLQFLFYALVFIGTVCPLGLCWINLSLMIRHANRGTTLPGYRTFSNVDWATVLLALAMLIALTIFVPVTAWLFARCNLSPFSENRMAPIRRWFSLFFLLALMLALAGDWGYARLPYWLSVHTWRVDDSFFLLWWVRIFVGTMAGMLILAVCERETWEGRLRRNIPKPIWKRLLVFPFYTGSINGLFWVFLWTVVFSIGAAIAVLLVGRMQTEIVVAVLELFRLILFLMLIFNYSMTAFFLWKILLRRWVPRDMIWTLTLGLTAAVSAGTYFAVFLARQDLAFLENDILLAPNPVMLLTDDSFNLFQPICGIFWFSLIILFGYPWLRARFLDFTPNEETSAV